MVSMLAYSSCQEELRKIKYQAEELAAYLTDEKWDIVCCSALKDVSAFLDGHHLLQLACYDVTGAGSIGMLGKMRAKQDAMLLMVIADSKMPPTEYVRPDILAASLILRPFTEEMLADKLRDLILKYNEQADSGNTEDSFVLEKRGERTLLSYRQIYYIEARDKRIYVRVMDKEYAIYGTIDELEKKLPNMFLRCHRSFLINRLYLEKVSFSKNEILLARGITIPLSRSYKHVFKQF